MAFGPCDCSLQLSVSTGRDSKWSRSVSKGGVGLNKEAVGVGLQLQVRQWESHMCSSFLQVEMVHPGEGIFTKVVRLRRETKPVSLGNLKSKRSISRVVSA